LARTIDRTRIEQLREALAERGVAMEYVDTGAEALARLQELVPVGSNVQTGSSTTLDQIGFTAWLNERHAQGKLRYFRAETQQVSDAAVRTENRRQATLAEYFLGSVNALTEDGIAVAADAAGTRVGGYVFGAVNVIWVVGVNKIVPTLDDAVRRIWEVALPGEDARVKSIGGHGSEVGKMVFFHHERPGRIRMLLVGEELGF
jgi:L-lactate utilization protein LutB